jgi:hypothetical protein|tara:strand:- start:292 stop:843 length:552 start_codon:yes stop_codon:yes gene_type:complete
MKNYFSILDLSPSLVISTSEVEKAWRALNDSVADSESSETSPEWNGARAVLSDEVRRLEHWLTLKAPNEPADRSINPSLMDLFSAIGPVIASTESVIARQNAATTALAKALLTKEAIGAQLQIQEMLQQVGAAKHLLIAEFPFFEEASHQGNFDEANRALGQLKFLKRWEEQCKEKLLGLIHS